MILDAKLWHAKTKYFVSETILMYKIYFIHVLISLKSSETMTNLPPWKAMINAIWGKLADINSRKTKGRF